MCDHFQFILIAQILMKSNLLSFSRFVPPQVIKSKITNFFQNLKGDKLDKVLSCFVIILF